MKTPAKRRFIPYRKSDIGQMCLTQNRFSKKDGEKFLQICKLLGSTFHFEFHSRLEKLKDTYADSDPDSDTRTITSQAVPPEGEFVQQLEQLLDKANYERISEADLNQALNQQSVFKIRLFVELADFSEVLLYSRGESIRREVLVSWFGLKKTPVKFINFDRLVIYIKFKNQSDPQHKSFPIYKTNARFLKLFQNVPKADLEMLFPNTSVRMRTIDKLLIGVPAVVSGSIVLSTKLGTSLVLLGSLFGFWVGLHSHPVELNKPAIAALLAGFGALVTYLWRQYNNFKNRKLRFMQELTQNLYFKNLDNNAGVFHRLINDAEEEECKEAVLAYFFIVTSTSALTKQLLDQEIEAWFAAQWQCELNFEIDDALDKLIRLNLVSSKDNILFAKPLDEAYALLCDDWRNIF